MHIAFFTFINFFFSIVGQVYVDEAQVCSLQSLLSETKQYGSTVESYFSQVLEILGAVKNTIVRIDQGFLFRPAVPLEQLSKVTDSHGSMCSCVKFNPMLVGCAQDVSLSRVTDIGFFNWSLSGFYFGQAIDPNKSSNETFPYHALKFDVWTVHC